MTNMAKETGPAQADHIEQPESDRGPTKAEQRDQRNKELPKNDEIEGADGPSQASATDDTYD